MEQKFVLRNCDSRPDETLATREYAEKLMPFAKKHGVGINMTYNDETSDLEIECRGENHVAACAIMVSIMTASMILGARQDSEWRPIMEEAWSIMSEDSVNAGKLISSMAKKQLDLANTIRLKNQRSEFKTEIEMPGQKNAASAKN